MKKKSHRIWFKLPINLVALLKSQKHGVLDPQTQDLILNWGPRVLGEALAKQQSRKGCGQRKEENAQLCEISQNSKHMRKTIL